MFAAIMQDEEQCRLFLEMVLEMKISSVSVVTEDALVYHSEQRGVRLDVHAVENGIPRHFNVEMQVERKPGLPRRCRYYHSQIDMYELSAGKSYTELPDTYVIFICDFDPVGDQLYRYTFRNQCEENGKVFEDGSVTILLSTKGENAQDVPEELVNFLEYVGAPENAENEAKNDPYIKSLEKQIAWIKRSRGWEARYMLLRETLEDERRAGREEGMKQGLQEGIKRGHQDGMKQGLKEGMKQGLQDGFQRSIITLMERFGEVPGSIRTKVESEKDTDKLNRWIRLAAEVTSVEEFLKQM